MFCMCHRLKPGIVISKGLFVVSLALVSACAADSAEDLHASTPAAPTAGHTAEAALDKQIMAVIGDAACSHDSQCHVLPLGAKACGGPTSWVAHSQAAASAVRLSKWAGELADLQRTRDEKSGMVSTCEYLPEPPALCESGRCQLRPPNSLAR